MADRALYAAKAAGRDRVVLGPVLPGPLPVHVRPGSLADAMDLPVEVRERAVSAAVEVLQRASCRRLDPGTVAAVLALHAGTDGPVAVRRPSPTSTPWG